MRVLLSTYGSRGDVEPMAGLAGALRALGAEVRVCAPPDFADLLARVGVPLVPAGLPVREMVREVFTGKKPPSAADLAAGVIAGQADAVALAAEGCDVLVAAGLTTAAAGAQAVSEKRGLRYLDAAYAPCYLPSPYYPPLSLHGQPAPPDVTDNRVLWELHAQGMNAVFGAPVNAYRASLGLSAVDNVRDYVSTGHPLLAADPTLAPWPEPAGFDVVQTGAWILPDERPLPEELEAFLDAGAPPVYVSFGSMRLRAAEEVARVVVEAVRAQGRRVLLGTGWADLALIDDQGDCLAVGEVNQQALFRRVADQLYWAARVADLGIGVAHDGPVPTAGSLSAALGTALAPETVVRAAAVAGVIRTDGATVAAKLLLEAVTGSG